MPIRVLQVVNYMGRGGLETMLMNYYRNIDRDKVQFDFLTHRQDAWDYDEEIEALGGTIYHLPRLNPFSPAYRKAMKCFFKEHPEYRIVHSHFDCMAGIPLMYAKKSGVPVRIAHAHNNNQDKNLKYPLKLWFKRNIPKYSNYRFACSREAGEWMFGGGKFSVLNNAIDAEQYCFNEEARIRIRQELGISPKTLVVGEVARFMPQKNQIFLLDIFKEIVKIHPESRLLLVGDGNLKEKIEKKCEQLGIFEKVILTGVRSDVADLLQVMDVFVLPSLYEGLGMSCVEAQAAGLPCVISDHVPEECTLTENLVERISLNKSAEEWAQRIVKKKEIRRINTLGQIQKGGYDIQNNAKRLQAFYLHMYEKAGSR